METFSKHGFFALLLAASAALAGPTDSTSWLGVPSARMARGFDASLVVAAGYLTDGEQTKTGLTPEPDVLRNDLRLEAGYYWIPGLASQLGLGHATSRSEHSDMKSLDLYERWTGRLGVSSTLPVGASNVYVALQGGASLGLFQMENDYLAVLGLNTSANKWAREWQWSPGWYAGGRLEYRMPAPLSFILGLGGEYNYERATYKRSETYFSRAETIVLDASAVQFVFSVGYNFK